MAIEGDRPIERPEDDRLGFAPLADRLAPALIDQASCGGLVVGIEGKWGSGKSCLLNLTLTALQRLPNDTKPVVVQFRPWLVGDRNALLTSLFADLANAIETAEGNKQDSKISQSREARQAAEKLRAFAAHAELLGAALSFVPAAGAVANGLRALGASAKKLDLTVPLRKRKEEIEEALGSLSKRIIVAIDDVDRLEPSEALELMRLVRSVADFENVIYLMCFDHEVLAESIETAAGVANGHAFLEKIVQVTVNVPTPESFVLRRWFAAELAKFTAAPESEDIRKGSDGGRRLTNVIDLEAGRWLRRPRDVSRALDALRIVWPALKDNVDLADLVWLKLVQVGYPRLHRWIEGYCTASAAASSWRVSVADDDKRRDFDELNEILARRKLSFSEVEHLFGSILPGIRGTFPGETDVPIYRRVSRQEMQGAAEGHRLASPDHYRLYFALAEPSMAVKEIDFERLVLATSQSIRATANLLREWLEDIDATVGTRADVMLDRLQNDKEWRLNQSQSETLVSALADVLDEAFVVPPADFGPSTWGEAERLLRRIRQEFVQRARPMTLKVFRHGKAIAWLTSVFRHETMGHGRVDGSRPLAQRDWMMSDAELDAISAVMCQRYKKMTFAQWSQVRRPLSMLFAWFQGGGAEDATAFVSRHLKSEEGLVEMLELLGGVSRTTEGEFIAFTRNNLGPFLPYEETRRRIEKAAKSSTKLSTRARLLLDRFKAADAFE